MNVNDAASLSIPSKGSVEPAYGRSGPGNATAGSILPMTAGGRRARPKLARTKCSSCTSHLLGIKDLGQGGGGGSPRPPDCAACPERRYAGDGCIPLGACTVRRGHQSLCPAVACMVEVEVVMRGDFCGHGSGGPSTRSASFEIASFPSSSVARPILTTPPSERGRSVSTS